MSARLTLSPTSRRRIYALGMLLIGASFVLIVLGAFVPGIAAQMVAHPIAFGCTAAKACKFSMTATVPMYTLVLGVTLSVFPPLLRVGVNFGQARGWLK